MIERLGAALANRYRIERQLGAGGMASVYLAHDIRHERHVAIKVLHPDLGAALGSERFLSEIRTTARLQHPHILPLLDSGEADGLLYYVMPVVAGESLRTRLERERQLSLPDTIRIASEVASALDYAHRHGVIHRDIKPENILLHDGQAMVADFGISLAVQHAGGARMTQTGLSLGTPQYMSPEQAMGERTIDARSDVYALGAVTYEMLVGEPPFTGPTVQAIVAKVLNERPVALHTMRDTVPAGVEDAVFTALAKLPADRFATAAEFATALQSGRTSASTALPSATRAATSRPRWRDPLVIGLSALVMLLGAVTWMLWSNQGRTETLAVRSVIEPESEGTIGPGSMSHDGRSVVFTGGLRGMRGQALVRHLDELTSREVPGAVGVMPAPVFSPDGQWIAYIQGRRRVVRIPVAGGTPTPLAEVPDNGGIAWSPDDEIIIGAGVDEGLEGLSRISASGGPVRVLTRVDTARGELSHQAPVVLRDGSAVLFTIRKRDDQFEVGAASLRDSQPHTPLGIDGLSPLGVVDDKLVYQDDEGALLAVTFDAGRFRVDGTPVKVLEGLRLPGGSGLHAASLTANGGLVYLRGNENRRLVWVDRRGLVTPVTPESREYLHVMLSPDGRRVALAIVTGYKRDIWVLDVTAGTLTPLTSVGLARNPVWTSDGKRILFGSPHAGGRAGFWWQDADGNGSPTRAASPRNNPWQAHLSPDGRRIVFQAISQGTFNIETVSLDSGAASEYLTTSATSTEGNPRFSPDGMWIAYNSDESGRQEVYVRPSTAAGGRVQVSVNGGRRPIWSRDGKRLYYWEGERMTEAGLATDPNPRVLSRIALFSGRYVDDFDVAADGRFLMIEAEWSGVSLVAIPNWRAELNRLTAR
ncbi:MAG: protein kinase domain-containing protein [Gemmatimonadota bacterium]